MGHLEAKELNSCERLCCTLDRYTAMDVPTVADDVLHCSIFPPVDANAAVFATQISRYVEQWLPNHIWHRDSFRLVLSKDVEGTLECTMRVGDSVDDEWLVVWLLFQITKEFDVVARYVCRLLWLQPIYWIVAYMMPMESSCSSRQQMFCLAG